MNREDKFDRLARQLWVETFRLTSDLLSSSSVEAASSRPPSSSSPLLLLLLLDSCFLLLFFCSFSLCLRFFSFFF